MVHPSISIILVIAPKYLYKLRPSGKFQPALKVVKEVLGRHKFGGIKSRRTYAGYPIVRQSDSNLYD
jgi:hypothetical protein